MADQHDRSDTTPIPAEGSDGRVAATIDDQRRAAADGSSVSRSKPSASPPNAGRTARRVGSWVLVALTCITVAAGAVALWSNLVLLDTSRFISIIRPIARDPAVDEAVSARASQEIVRALRVQERAEEVLPSRAGFLSFTLQEAAQGFLERQLDDLLKREGFQDAWLSALRLTHEQIVRVLRGQSTSVALRDGVVTLNLFPLIDAGMRRLEGTGLLPGSVTLPVLNVASPGEARQQLSSALGVQLPDDFGEVPVAEAPQLDRAQRAVRLFDTSVYILPAAALLLAVGVVALSLDRRRTVIALSVGIAALLVLCGLLVDLFGREAVNAVRDQPTGFPVVQATVNALTDNLWGFLVPVIAVAVGAAVVAFLAGKREWFAVAGSATRTATGRLGESGRWIAQYDDALRVGGLVAALALLVLLDLSWGTLALVLLLLVAYLAAVTVIASRWRSGSASAPASV